MTQALPDEVLARSLAEVSRLLQRREVSPVELVEVALRRVDALNPRLNCFITIGREDALAVARQAEAEIVAGRYRGPLHGVPLALKDLFAVRGWPTTAGSRILAKWVPAADATVVDRLRQAGAILLGTLNLHEFALGATSENPHYGPVRNPWDPERIAGGSSGGSAAGVAAGLFFGSLGTDTAGSIRIPSALCGVVGLKPTYGLVSRHGLIPLAKSMDHVGPLARTALDAALLLDAVAGPDPQDPTTIQRPPARLARDLEGFDGSLRGWRLGVLRDLFDQVDPAVESLVRRAIEELGKLGAVMEEATLPLLAAAQAALRISRWEASRYHEAWLTTRPDDYGADVRARLEEGLTVSDREYRSAQRTLGRLSADLRALFRRFDLLVGPTVPFPAPLVGTGEVAVGGRTEPAAMGLLRLTRAFNPMGVPAISMPCGLAPSGLPVGLQLIARRLDERALLRAAHAYEQVTDWPAQLRKLQGRLVGGV